VLALAFVWERYIPFDMARRSTQSLSPTPKPLLKVHALKLSAPEAELLKRLADELADRTGRASSRSATVRALIRLSAQFDGAMLERLADAMVSEFYAGVKWGRDARRR
jgi:hypothetical protein